MLKNRIRKIIRPIRQRAKRWSGEVKKSLLAQDTLPGFLIIGAQKAGTTSLYKYLAQHPSLVPSYSKELSFFSSAKFNLGSSWYQKQFPPGKAGQIHFEATPCYIFLPRVAQRIFEFEPAMKFILLLRDPYIRAYSGWNKYRDNHRDRAWRKRISNEARKWAEPGNTGEFIDAFSRDEYPSFADTVRQEIAAVASGRLLTFPSNVQRGLYHMQISRYLDLFNRDQFLILEDRELREEPAATLGKVWDFLGVDHMDTSVLNLKEANVRHYDLDIDPETDRLLREFYHPHNLKLYELLGREYDWTSP